MTRILVLSDLHVEFGLDDVELPDPSGFDVVVVPGDVSSCPVSSIEWAEARFDRPVVMIAGAREYHGRHRKGAVEAARARSAASPNVRFLEDETTFAHGVRFVGSTLWTDFRLYGPEFETYGRDVCDESVVDYRYIWGDRRRTMPFGTGHAQAIHFESIAYIRQVLSIPYDGPTVVVTHHAPHRRSVERMARGDFSTLSASSHLERDIADLAPTAWIHGCVHDSFVYEVASTRIACNARGPATPLGRENARFDPAMILAV